MSKMSPMPAAGAGRVITLDYLTAAGHPDAVVTGVLLVVILLLVSVGLVGLLAPVVSLELYDPDLTFANFARLLGQIAVSILALVAAGLGLAKHPRFPTVFLVVAFGLTVLSSLAASLEMFTSDGLAAANPGAFPILGALVALAVPYIVFSRKCRLIFQRRMSLNDLDRLADDQNWSAAPSMAAPALPRPDTARTPAQAPRRQQRARKAAGPALAAPVAEYQTGSGGGSLTVPATPPADATAAALWAALYGPSSPSLARDEAAAAEATAAGGAASAANRRVGLEALVNLRTPGA